jgi:hypothetical protein
MELKNRYKELVFAPCPHRLACPLLSRPQDWCHEDLSINLPDRLVPVAKLAGLRWQGLSFSYLILRKDGKNLGKLLSDQPTARIVSSLQQSRGKQEVLVCGTDFARIRRLDRHASESNSAFAALNRGDLLKNPPSEILPTTPINPHL